MGKIKSQPNKEEVTAQKREQQAANLSLLREARALAKDAFKTETPDFEQVAGIASAIESGIGKDLIVPMISAATDLAGKIGATATAAIFSLCNVLLEDEQGEDHVLAAHEEAKQLFPTASGETSLDVYFFIYGEDEE